MHYTVRRSYCWLHVANDVYTYVETYLDFRKQRRQRMHQRFSKLFSPDGQMKSYAVNIVGLLLKTKFGNRFVIVITDGFSRSTRETPAKKIIAFYVSEIVTDTWSVPYRVQKQVLLDSGSQFAGAVTNAACVSLGTQLLTTTAFQPQSNRQTGRFRLTLVHRSRK